MNRRRKQPNEIYVKNLRNRAFVKILNFTEKLIVWVTTLFILNWFVSIALIIAAIKATGNFQYLDTLIIETSETFRQIIVAGVIKFGVENIFKYNDFGGRVPSKSNEDVEEFMNEEEGGME